MVPKGWTLRLPKGNVNYAVQPVGERNASTQLACYRFLYRWDLQAVEEKSIIPHALSPKMCLKALVTRIKTWRTHVLQAPDIMFKIAEQAHTALRTCAVLSACKSESKFIDADTARCRALHQGMPDTCLDAKRMHEESCLRVYSALSKLGILWMRHRNLKRKKAPQPVEY